MLSVLFWNLNGRYRERVCARLAHRHAATVVALAECPDPAAMLAALNPHDREANYHLIPNAAECRVQLFARAHPDHLPAVVETTHYTARRFQPGGAAEILLVAAHMPSKLLVDDHEQDGQLRALAAAVADAERRVGHARTVLIGDLNADPFQNGVFAADGLHAVPARAVAGAGSRVVRRVEYPMFYNPSWRFFGDADATPPGTYYRRKAELHCRFWHVFDQALIRPSLLPAFDPRTGLTVVTGHDDINLSRPDGTPDPRVGSDHFPILLRLRDPEVRHEHGHP